MLGVDDEISDLSHQIVKVQGGGIVRCTNKARLRTFWRLIPAAETSVAALDARINPWKQWSVGRYDVARYMRMLVD